MRFSESYLRYCRSQALSRRRHSAWGVLVLTLILGACTASSPPPLSPTQVCQAVTESLLGFKLPLPDKMAISEQEIRGERIVTQLKFARPADNYPVQVVCVFAVDKYAPEGVKHTYSKVPTRMAVNSKQVTEADLIKAIEGSNPPVD